MLSAPGLASVPLVIQLRGRVYELTVHSDGHEDG